MSLANYLVNYFDYYNNQMNFFPNNRSGGVDRTEQIKGAALVPKRAMNLMEAEVNRLLVLCRNSIIPASYIVPRKVSLKNRK